MLLGNIAKECRLPQRAIVRRGMQRGRTMVFGLERRFAFCQNALKRIGDGGSSGLGRGHDGDDGSGGRHCDTQQRAG
jgi:hypothetical protein